MVNLAVFIWVYSAVKNDSVTLQTLKRGRVTRTAVRAARSTDPE